MAVFLQKKFNIRMLKRVVHIIMNISAIVLVLATLTPSFLKFVHAFENHKHEVCTNPQTTHFHSLDLDCEFYKFKVQTQAYKEALDFSFLEFNHLANSLLGTFNSFNKSVLLNYNITFNTHFSSFYLRGPPSLS